MTEVETLSMDSVIQPNTQFYVRMGHYTQYFIEDYLTGKIAMVIFPPSGMDVIELEEGITYKDLNPDHKGEVHFMTKGFTPFTHPEFVTTETGIFRVLLTDGVSYLSSDRDKLKEEYLFTLENLATGDKEYFNYNSIHETRTKGYYTDLYNLYSSGYPMVQAFIKGLIHNREYAKALSHGEALKAVEDIEVLKGIFESSKYGYIATPGGYNYDGSDYYFFTQLSEDGSLVTIKKFFYPSNSEESCRLVAKQDLKVEDFQEEFAEITARNLGKSFQEILTLFEEGTGFFFATNRREEKMPTNYIEDL